MNLFDLPLTSPSSPPHLPPHLHLPLTSSPPLTSPHFPLTTPSPPLTSSSPPHLPLTSPHLLLTSSSAPPQLPLTSSSPPLHLPLTSPSGFYCNTILLGRDFNKSIEFVLNLYVSANEVSIPDYSLNGRTV